LGKSYRVDLKSYKNEETMFTGSKNQILEFIKRNGIVSIDQIKQDTELAKTTLREHLLQLERDGYIGRDYERNGPGRPSLRYQLTSKGHGLYPSYEVVLIRKLVRYLRENGQEELLEDFFKAFWDERLKRAREIMDEASQNDPKKRMNALAKMLQEEGFMPELTLNESGKGIKVRECNCPFSDVIKETRLPCQLEHQFFQKLFDEEVERKTFIAEGDYSCTYSIPMEVSEVP
jgi:predicted ArsR family transcriptional regulator